MTPSQSHSFVRPVPFAALLFATRGVLEPPVLARLRQFDPAPFEVRPLAPVQLRLEVEG
jgi:hypothetical protein